jgi:hypothetical protein
VFFLWKCDNIFDGLFQRKQLAAIGQQDQVFKLSRSTRAAIGVIWAVKAANCFLA